MAPTDTKLQLQFFDYLFGATEGYLCISTGDPKEPKNKGFKDNYFKWPEGRVSVGGFIAKESQSKNIWFCTSLLETESRKKTECLPGNIVWSDLDHCDYNVVDPRPSCVIQSSPGRFQAIWRLGDVLAPEAAERYSKRIAYAYADQGADKSGWDLTQLLRVPYTNNFKYRREDTAELPRVEILHAMDITVPVVLFEALPEVLRDGPDNPEAPMPDPLSLPDPANVIYKYIANIDRAMFIAIYDTPPAAHEDWSKLMWRLIMMCLEAGMTREEVFAVVLNAKCNKYARDNRPVQGLWNEIIKGEASLLRLLEGGRNFVGFAMPVLVDDDIEDDSSFIHQYKDWAVNATDACEQYHELAAFILLSAVMAGGLSIELEYGSMRPNIWGLILGDSTLTRKTTAMRMAMDFVADIDHEIIVGTEGSSEGLLSGLSLRPDKTSIWYKDEISGFFDSISKKDYLAGMPEILTQLYDVPRVFTRRLRKEVIVISSPVFIFFGGGIRDRVYELITDELILSGFLPRFMIVSGEADLSKLRRTTAASNNGTARRDKLSAYVQELYHHYNSMQEAEVLGQKVLKPVQFTATLSAEAWEFYGDLETDLLTSAYNSPISAVALPTFERMSRTILKMGVLLAAAKQRPKIGEPVVASLDDIKMAARYAQDWGRYTVDLLLNSGKSQSERLIQRVLTAVKANPDVSRGQVLQKFHMTSKQANEVLGTLQDRGLIVVHKVGKATLLRAI